MHEFVPEEYVFHAVFAVVQREILIYGAYAKTEGELVLDGDALTISSTQDALDNGIVYISEDRKGNGLVLGMSVKENMTLPALQYFSSFWGLKHAAEQQAVSDFIRLFNIKTPSMQQPIRLLSGGNQQKVAIARGLMTRPKVLILDDNNNLLYDNFFDLENTPKLDYKFHWKDYEK